LGAAGACWYFWPNSASSRETLLSGLQKIAFVSAAFAVTAYNLRTRVVDLVLKIETTPSRFEEYARIARNCGTRLTNLVLLFTITALALGGLTIFPAGHWAARAGASVSLCLLAGSCVSFCYILLSFDRLERFALDEAERATRDKEAKRLFGQSSPPEE